MDKSWMHLIKYGKLLLLGMMAGAALAGCSSGGDENSSPTPASLSGTAASGLPMASAAVSIKDKNGISKSATTLADGTYSADVTNMTAPYLIKVGALYSVATASGTANVHPFTDMIVRSWYKVKGSDVDTAFAGTGAMATPPTAAEIDTIEGVVRQVLATYIRGADVNPSNFNLITTPFTANHSGFDLVLDNVKVTQPTSPGGNVTIGLAGGGTTGTILTVAENTSLATITPPPAPVSDTVAPTTPGGITASRTSSTQVVLSWGVSTDTQLAGYKIYRSGTQVGITDQPFYIDGAATNGATDCYTVAAYDAAGNSSGQNTQVCSSATLVAADVAAPTAPGSLTAVASSSSQIDLAWTASTDAGGIAGYRVMVGGSAITTLPATATSYSHTGLNGSTQYSYTVVAIDTSGNATSSNQASATTSAKTDTTAPTVPSGVTATEVSSSQINLTWTASNDAVGVAGYNVYSGATLVGTSVTASYSAVNLTAATQYCYTVKAYDAAGNASAASAQVCATTQASALPSTIVGGWTMDGTVGTGNLITLTLFANGDYVFTQDYVNFTGTNQPGGMERGKYSFNPTTGAFNILCPALVDTNGDAGVSHPLTLLASGACYGTTGTASVSGNALMLVTTGSPNAADNGTSTFTRLVDATNPAVGAWSMTSMSTSSGPIAMKGEEVVIVLPNGEYVLATSGEIGSVGIEHATVAWNSGTGAFSSACPTLDTNAFGGLSSVATPACGVPVSQGATMSLSGSMMAISIPNAWGTNLTFTDTFTRVTAPTSTQPAQTFTEFALPAGSRSLGIASGPDGNLWFTDEGTNSIGKMTPAGVVIEYAIPSTTALPGKSGPQTIIAGPDGNMWFVEGNSNNIAKITTGGVITEYANTAGGWPQDLAVGQDGNIWFTDQGVGGGGDPAVNANGSIGKLNIATGAITKYPLLSANTQANWITRGPDGAMWFTQGSNLIQGGSNIIARITTAGVITEFANTSANLITTGPDGNLWVTTPMGVANVTTAGVQTGFSIPTTTNTPFFIAPAADGNLWFGEVGGSFATGFTSAGALGRITTSGVISEFTLPASSNNNPGFFTIGQITVGSDGALWFTEPQSGKIGRFQP